METKHTTTGKQEGLVQGETKERDKDKQNMNNGRT